MVIIAGCGRLFGKFGGGYILYCKEGNIMKESSSSSVRVYCVTTAITTNTDGIKLQKITGTTEHYQGKCH